ncbi:MAG: RdgB/HAM1 family non-canonical purine NTP pyrophosphatase [Bacilli bacterium]|nr:RdgB/HAM1 family non-canonical purine NTP pyrophosphatase [Bacilli bacterium]MBR6866147.1 RdgB/HAM1 family non-canonical purine NTP pyrophosphatase [Bacilli bacterium]
MEKIIVLASHNKGKIKEFQKILEPFGYVVKTSADFGHTEEPVEDGKTYQENAYIKAKYYHDALKMPVISDDSGIEIEALGEHYPGVHSARFADKIQEELGKGYEVVNAYILEKIKGNPNRKAAYHCAICLIEKDGEVHYFDGVCEGQITDKITGTHGFGYDPIFKADEGGLYFGIVSEDEKNKISHRGKALQKFVKYLKEKEGN